MFKVIATDTYLKEISKWSKADQELAQRLADQLAENPSVGRQLSSFLRE